MPQRKQKRVNHYLFFLIIILGLVACQRLFTPENDIILHTFDVIIDDENGVRSQDYALVAQNLDPVLYGSYFKNSDIPWYQINSPDDSLAATLPYDFNFEQYNYDLVCFNIPDPGCYSECIHNVYKDSCRILTFRVFRSRAAEVVPMVIVAQSYLFQYNKG